MPAASTSTSIAGATDAANKPYTPPQRGERTAPIRRSARACAYCRKSKARCDGPELWPCRRCRESGVECVFEGVPQEELGTKNLGPPAEDGLPRRPGSPYSMERRLIALEREIEHLRATQSEHSRRLGYADPGSGTPRRTSLPALPQMNGYISDDTPKDEMGEISLDNPAYEELGRNAVDTFWSTLAPWAPYMDPELDTYDRLRARSPLLLFCVLAIASRYLNSPHFSQYCESEALRHMRATLYSETPTTLDDCKGTTLYNAWLSRGSPPGHSMTMAAQLELPQKLGKLLAAVNQPPAEATKAFDELMPQVRVWLTLYCQDLWLSVATGRRSMVTIDYNITSARSLLKFAALRPVDARIVAQCELVTILGGVQESFLKVRQSIPEAVKIVQQADEHLDYWMKTWSDWAQLQEGATAKYMSTSFAMQLHVGRFYISTLGLKDIASESDIQPEQKPVMRTAINAALEAQKNVVVYGTDRMAHATEFTQISTSSAALFLLKMIKLMPDLVPDIPAALAAVRESSRIMSGAPRHNYHLAVAGALAHLESHLLSPSYITSPAATGPTKASGGQESTNGDSSLGLIGTDDPPLFDPDLAELEISISSVVGTSDFWSWSQSLPADSFQGILS